MKGSAKPAPNPAAATQQIAPGEAILVNLDTAASLALTNPSAVAVWQLVNGERTVEQIIAAVRSQFRDVPDTVTDDVVALLDTLAEDGFVGFEWTGAGTDREA